MEKGIVSRLSIVGLSLILTAGLLGGCSSGETDSPTTNTSEQHAEKQSEEEQDHVESSHEQEGHHDDEGHPEEMDHNDEDQHEHDHDHERTEHFEGKEAKTYDEAVSNMKSANNKLEERLAKDELSGEDFYKIHRMSYTMENALEVIREESEGDFAGIAENLESVHLASEKRNAETVRQEGKKYLEGVRAMLEKDHDHAESHHEEEGHEHGPDHFEGKEAKTYDQAVANMKEANGKLEDLLAQDELTGEAFYKIHRMSYTMENALEKFREESSGDYADVAKSLESVHLASEKRNAETVRQEGKKYLEGARAMLQKE